MVPASRRGPSFPLSEAREAPLGNLSVSRLSSRASCVHNKSGPRQHDIGYVSVRTVSLMPRDPGTMGGPTTGCSQRLVRAYVIFSGVTLLCHVRCLTSSLSRTRRWAVTTAYPRKGVGTALVGKPACCRGGAPLACCTQAEHAQNSSPIGRRCPCMDRLLQVSG